MCLELTRLCTTRDSAGLGGDFESDRCGGTWPLCCMCNEAGHSGAVPVCGVSGPD